MSFAPIKDGEYTSTIYSLIAAGKYNDVIRILQYEVQKSTTDYMNAAICYEKLANLFPSLQEYKLYHAQCLYNAFMTPDAIGILTQIEDPKYMASVTKLMAAIKYREDDMRNARVFVEQFPQDDPDIQINLASIEYKEKNYTKALDRFYAVTNEIGFQPDLSYAVALCHYKKKEPQQAVRYISDIIDRGLKEHPELGVGSVTDGLEMRSVGNSLLLHETALIEACNLKFAIEYEQKRMTEAGEALTDMPPRSEEELDSVTLHNQALMSVETNPADGFAKLQYLLSQNPFPKEAFCNLLLLYCKYDYIDLAADVLAENAHLTFNHLNKFMYDYFNAIISATTSPDDAFNKFDILAQELIALLRKSHMKIQEATTQSEVTAAKEAANEYSKQLDRFVPVIMAQAKTFWDRKEYSRIEKLFQGAFEFASEHPTFRLNVAHTLFMQEKFKEAQAFYEPIVHNKFEEPLQLPAIVLANLCVCYIMTNQNVYAEDLIRKIERAEDLADNKSIHSSLINMVIGTLYCSKGQLEFGVSRVIKAMEPYDKKVGTDLWYYSKRCVINSLDALARNINTARDQLIDELLIFLRKCEEHGEDIPATLESPLADPSVNTIKNTVAYEARQLRYLLLEIIDT